MTELLKARDVLLEYWQEQCKISDQYDLNNDDYCAGLNDAVRILDKCINKEIERQAVYYEEN